MAAVESGIQSLQFWWWFRYSNRPLHWPGMFPVSLEWQRGILSLGNCQQIWKDDVPLGGQISLRVRSYLSQHHWRWPSNGWRRMHCRPSVCAPARAGLLLFGVGKQWKGRRKEEQAKAVGGTSSGGYHQNLCPALLSLQNSRQRLEWLHCGAHRFLQEKGMNISFP